MFTLIIDFAWSLLSGKLWAVWQAHKQKEAQNAVNKVDSLSESQLDKLVQQDLMRK